MILRYKNSGGSYKNTKYVHKNGQLEIVVDNNGKIIKDAINAGSYNYGYMYNSLRDKINIEHMDYDV